MFFLEIDLISFIVTFVSCLALRFEIGILLGIGVDILFLLYRAARPDVIFEQINVRLFLFRFLITKKLLV